ncbi:MAG TPA: complex I NDUFA9 subunit family protein [Alphaproteobacteria bacterium]|jgi:NADH dehydrogenase|nr:complex I NDUFA9 subunit family protein [Alphaproteobacteria bacterium]
MNDGLATVFGGSGFIGRHIVRRLAGEGWRLRVAVRDPEAGNFLKTMGEPGQVAVVQANLRDDDSTAAALDQADLAINCVGLLYERGAQSFDAVHAEGAGRVAQAAATAGAKQFVQLSAIGAAANSPARYGRSKWAGEEAVRQAFPDAAIIRPSVVFGPDDEFFNRLALLASLSPALPLFGPSPFDAGNTLFQPVYVGDVAEAVVRIVTQGSGGIFELGGPEVLSYRQIMELVLAHTGRQALLVPLPFALARLKAFFLEFMLTPLLTRDQLRLLEVDNVVGEGIPNLPELGITPTPIGTVLPDYLARFARGGLKPTAA